MTIRYAKAFTRVRNMLKQASSILRIIKCAKSLEIGTGLSSSSFKTTDFFVVNPFMGMFIICELRTVNLRTTKLRAKMRSHWSIDGSHVTRTVCILVLKIYIFRPAPFKTRGGSVNILHVSKCRWEWHSLVSTTPLTYVRMEGGRRKTGERIGTILKCESTKVRKYQA